MKASDIQTMAPPIGKAIGAVLRREFAKRDAQIETLQAQVAELQAKLAVLISQRESRT